MNFLQINSKVKNLGTAETYTFAFLISKANYKTKIAEVNLGLIAKVVTGKTTKAAKETVSNYVKTLEKHGLISIDRSNNKNHTANKYEILKADKFVEINYDMFLPEYNNISAKAKGLFIKMAVLAYKENGSLSKYTEKDIYTELKISENTYYKLRKELIDAELLENKQLAQIWYKTTDLKVARAKAVYEEELKKVLLVAYQSNSTKEQKRYQKQLAAVSKYMSTMNSELKSYYYGYNMLLRIQAGTFKAVKPLETELESITL